MTGCGRSGSIEEMRTQIATMVSSLGLLGGAVADAVPAAAGYFDLEGGMVAAASPVGDDGRITKVEAPVLRMFPSGTDEPRGRLLLLPGGGYRILSAVKEGSETAAFLNRLGYDVAMLDYRVNVGDDTRDLALGDALAAWKLVRENPERLGMKGAVTGVVGYSAGGHLAARAVMTMDAAARPHLLVLIYPAYLEEAPDGAAEPAVRPPVDAAGRRLFVAFAANDHAPWIDGTRAYAADWTAAGGTVAFHVFPEGGHGFGLTDTGNPAVRAMHEALPAFLLPNDDTR